MGGCGKGVVRWHGGIVGIAYFRATFPRSIVSGDDLDTQVAIPCKSPPKKASKRPCGCGKPNQDGSDGVPVFIGRLLIVKITPLGNRQVSRCRKGRGLVAGWKKKGQ